MSGNKSRDRGIAAERYMAIRLQRAAGRVLDPALDNIVTSTGRVGELTSLGFDILVGNHSDGTAIVGEAKRRKTTFGAEALRALVQIFRISVEWDREPAFCLALADNSEQWVATKKGKKRMPRRWVMFTLEYAEKLLQTQRLVNKLRRDSETFNSLWIGASMLDAVEQVETPVEEE